MSFNERLKQVRENKNLTQQEVADEIGKKKNSISDWETGKARPDVDILVKLCKLYKISADSLFEEFDDVENKGEILSADELHLIKNYRNLKPDAKEFVLLSTAAAFNTDDIIRQIEEMEANDEAISTPSSLTD